MRTSMAHVREDPHNVWKMAHLSMVYLLRMVIFYSYVSLPEGNGYYTGWWF